MSLCSLSDLGKLCDQCLSLSESDSCTLESALTVRAALPGALVVTTPGPEGAFGEDIREILYSINKETDDQRVRN